MSQETFWVLLSKKLSGEASASELKELEHLILEHPEWQYAIQNLTDVWQHQQQTDHLPGEDAYLLHLHRMNELNIPFENTHTPPEKKSVLRTLFNWKVAAAIVLIGGITGFIALRGNSSKQIASVSNIERQDNEISTRRGSKSKVRLPDGTVVLLNAGSKLTYNKDFGRENREVTLSGEGFFDVVRNKEKPFIIHTSDINIKVLGTVFNVRAYPEDKRTETSLIHGSIEVTMKNRPSDKIILSPSEKLVVENKQPGPDQSNPNDGDAGKMVMSVNKLTYNPSDSAVAETQWVDNKLVFRDESFEEVVARMGRWYDVDISITDSYLKSKRLSGVFEKETIVEALGALRISIPFKYDHLGKTIIIHR